ncbi:MAG TPA: hypothetical protein GXX19_13205 [Syntrophomonadaceae bacterium]|nr:hypothetical protein [Syntrophomonadaceae bacterium]
MQREWQIPMVLVTHDEEDAGALRGTIITLPGGSYPGSHPVSETQREKDVRRC